MKKSRKITLIIICSLLGFLIIAAVSTMLYINAMLDKITYSDGVTTTQATDPSEENKQEPTTEFIEYETDVPDPEDIQLPTADPASVEDVLKENLEKNSKDLIYDKNVLNILLIGCDYSANDVFSRSDSMILVSINKETKKVVLTSIMRDIYLSIPGHNSNRINTAHAFGGPSLLMDTIERNFGIKVDKYVRVNFDSFVEIIDKLGGVKIVLSDEEKKALKISAASGHGTSADGGIVLTGKQALSYSRLRSVGNSDFDRTNRQKKVLLQIISEFKNANIVQLNDVINSLLPNITTNLDKGEIYSLMLLAPSMTKYEMVQDRIPIDGSYQGVWINNMLVMTIDFQKNIDRMKTVIYGISID